MMSESRANPGAPPALPAGTMAFGEDAIIGEPPKLPHVLKKECSYDKAKTAGISPCAPNDDANKIFTAQEMESLFVDASFFSKLGFLQPPSCMTCAYCHAHQGTDYMYQDAIDAKGCNSFVLWRKDTSITIHPGSIHSNMLVVTCQTAKNLLRGESMDAGLTKNKPELF